MVVDEGCQKRNSKSKEKAAGTIDIIMRTWGRKVAEAMKQQDNNGPKGQRSHEAIGATM